MVEQHTLARIREDPQLITDYHVAGSATQQIDLLSSDIEDDSLSAFQHLVGADRALQGYASLAFVGQSEGPGRQRQEHMAISCAAYRSSQSIGKRQCNTIKLCQ